jgi:cell division protease FtsH
MWPFTPPLPPPSLPFTTIIIYLVLFWVICKAYGEKKEKRKKNLPTMDKVIGLESVKAEMRQYMTLIDNDMVYLTWKVNLPRGILLVGPPGTGKTLLVKALAKDLKLPIETASGSDFVEKYVGVGAARIRALFSRARKHDKCVIFIDEIDAVGAIRSHRSNSERASTLNQLLVEMDGFNSSSNIIVFAATNLAKILDPALLRSGRFDKKIFFDLPNPTERKELFKLYIGDTNTTAKSEELASRTTGMSGADIANIVNQAKLNAMANKNKLITAEDMDVSIDEIMIGREKRERSLTATELERVAHHEAGHALVSCMVAQANPPLKVSIIPRGEFALGFSQDKPVDKRLHPADEIMGKVAVLLAGRAAEKVIYGNVSTGASDDIEKSTTLLNSYVTKWGMSSLYGPINPKCLHKGDSEGVLKEVRRLAIIVEDFVYDLLTSNKRLIRKIASLLLKQETISYDDLCRIVRKRHMNSVDVISS